MKPIHRLIENNLLKALKASPVVFLNGPRQAGKSTLVQKLAQKEFPAEYVTFDSTTQMAAAVSSPESYLRERKGPLIIDEVQLVPEIFRALKLVVDELRHKHGKNLVGRFLLTGSANIMALPKLSDSLVGRMHILTLYPISSLEALGTKESFLEKIFTKQFESDRSERNLTEVIRLSTFPEIVGEGLKRRTNWFDGYLTTILQRDVRALAEIDKLSILPNLLRVLANRVGGLINDADIARDTGLNHMTSRNYKTLFKMLFLTFEVLPWYRNIGKRLVKAPKGYFIDTLLICHLLQYDLDDLEIKRPEIFGHLLENFIATELKKQMTYFADRLELYHFRTNDHKEVDFVLEKSNGHIVGIEVKNRGNAFKADFKGLEVLQNASGDDFICGIVLYRGKDVVPFGKNMWAVPISNVWE